LFNNVYFENHALFEIIWKIWWGGLGHRQQHCAFALHAGYLRLQIHTIMLCNTHCFFTATVVARTRLSITCYMLHCLSCYILTVVTGIITTLWAVTPCSLVEGCWCFERPYRYLLHSTLKMKAISFTRNVH